MRKDVRPSWIPLLSAILIPIFLVVGGVLLSRSLTGDEEPEPQKAQITETGQAYVTVNLEHPNGAPVTGRRVTFVQTDPETEEVGEEPPEGATTIEKTTDAAGLVTLTLPKSGNLFISIEGTQTRDVIYNLQQNPKDTYELSLVLKE